MWRRPIEEAGGRMEEDARGIAVEASMGQPYLVQLIGSYVWDDAEDLARGVTAEEVRPAAADASEQFGRHVHGPVWHGLSDLDKRFLAAMLPDAASSAVGDVGRRWGHSQRSLSTYRNRLLRSGLISSVGHGRAAFADHTVRQYVQGQATAEGLVERPALRSFGRLRSSAVTFPLRVGCSRAWRQLLWRSRGGETRGPDGPPGISL